MYNTDTFTQYKNIHHGERGIIFCTGTSLNKFNTDCELYKNSVHVGVNSIIYHTPLSIDYYFVQDSGDARSPRGYRRKKPDYDSFKPHKQKFYGVGPGGKKFKWYLTGKDCKDGSALPYNTNTKAHYTYTTDIDVQLIGEGHTVAMTAIQFLLFTGVTDIYIVGADCNGPRINETRGKKYNLRGWMKMKKWIDEMSHVNINIVNPIGLTDIFKNYYQ
tara:strand:+ start:144 stop:794 length:651 start_codon:yes stop_codon:yes gene_type:complete